MVANQPSANKTIQVTLAPFWKRLAAWLYDLLGGVAVFVLALVVGYLVAYFVSLPWIENGETLSNSLSNNPLWLIYLAASIQYYYVWCWVKGGQTVGMRAWRLKVCKPDGSRLGWKQAYLRSFVSLGGIGLLWSLFDNENRGLQDLACNSRVVLLTKDDNKPHKPTT